jgi:hypothetical protein
VSWDDGVVGVNIAELMEELFEESFDRVRSGVFGWTVDFDMEERLEEGRSVVAGGAKIAGRDKWWGGELMGGVDSGGLASPLAMPSWATVILVIGGLG